MPRPATGRRPIPVRLDPDLIALLDAEASDAKTNRSELIRTIVREHFTPRRGRKAAALKAADAARELVERMQREGDPRLRRG